MKVVWPTEVIAASRVVEGAILVRVHQEIDSPDWHVRQTCDERVSVGEPVTDGSFCYSPGPSRDGGLVISARLCISLCSPDYIFTPFQGPGM